MHFLQRPKGHSRTQACQRIARELSDGAGYVRRRQTRAEAGYDHRTGQKRAKRRRRERKREKRQERPRPEPVLAGTVQTPRPSERVPILPFLPEPQWKGAPIESAGDRIAREHDDDDPEGGAAVGEPRRPRPLTPLEGAAALPLPTDG
jgi:hypothetical protein